MSVSIEFWTYEADTHCVDCATDRFEAAIGNDVNPPLDDEGNPVHPVFSTDEWEGGANCGSCGAMLREVTSEEETEAAAEPISGAERNLSGVEVHPNSELGYCPDKLTTEEWNASHLFTRLLWRVRLNGWIEGNRLYTEMYEASRFGPGIAGCLLIECINIIDALISRLRVQIKG